MHLCRQRTAKGDKRKPHCRMAICHWPREPSHPGSQRTHCQWNLCRQGGGCSSGNGTTQGEGQCFDPWWCLPLWEVRSPAQTFAQSLPMHQTHGSRWISQMQPQMSQSTSDARWRPTFQESPHQHERSVQCMGAAQKFLLEWYEPLQSSFLGVWKHCILECEFARHARQGYPQIHCKHSQASSCQIVGV